MADVIELPPTPADVVTAVARANALAYGRDKHVNVSYWFTIYQSDPDYTWKRLLGWQAEGGPDQATYGKYAVPPCPWHEDLSAPPKPPVSLPPVDLVDAVARLADQVAELRAELHQVGAQLAAIAGVQARGVTGSLFGYRVTLTPPR